MYMIHQCRTFDLPTSARVGSSCDLPGATTSCEHSGHAARTRPGLKKQGVGKEKSGGLMQKMSGWWFGT